MRNWLLMLLVLNVVLLGLTGCRPEGQAEATVSVNKPERVLIPVEADYLDRGTISAYFETTSRVMAENRVEVISKGVGECVALHIEEGDIVKAGQVLAELEKNELDVRLRQSRVSVQQTHYQMRKAREQLEEGLMSSFEAENARFAYDQAEATLEMQELELEHQSIVAPIGGVVTQRAVQVGMMVSQGMPAFSIVDPSSYVLPINPPEKELMRLSVGQAAKVTIDSQKGEEFTADVRRINPSVDPQSGTVKVMLDFDEETRGMLREAAFARVRLVMETREDVLLVPKDVLLEENARKYLMVLREETAEEAEEADGTSKETAPSAEEAGEAPAEDQAAEKKTVYVAERVEVQTGLEDSNNVEILSGVDDDTRIVTLGQHTLKPGSAVVITNAQEEILSRAGQSLEEAIAAMEEKRRSVGG